MEQIRYFAPLEGALDQMRALLFRPFSMRRWLALALMAWLAEMPSGSRGRLMEHLNSGSTEATAMPLAGLAGLTDALPAVSDGSAIAGLIGGMSLFVVGSVVLVVFALGLLFLWLSSRAKFVWVENVWHGSSAIKAPWRRFKRQGDSLFWWRLGLIALAFLVVGIPLFGAVIFGASGLQEFSPLLWVGVTLCALPLLVGVIYCLFWAEGFVLPLMIRYDTDFLGGVRHFVSLLRDRPGAFLLVGLMVLGINICAALLVLALVVLSLGIGLLLLLVPYVGTVLLLPIAVTVRAYPIMWLAQLDPAFALSIPPPANRT
jgi:hypothetical protein